MQGELQPPALPSCWRRAATRQSSVQHKQFWQAQLLLPACILMSAVNLTDERKASGLSLLPNTAARCVPSLSPTKSLLVH